MLSYRHGFHAGNHADVLKHIVYQQVLKYLGKKNKPYSVIDTHAGAGAYTLTDEFGQKNKEYESGIGALWNLPSESLPAEVAEYVDAVKRFQTEDESNKGVAVEAAELKLESTTTSVSMDDGPVVYPGSPWFALDTLPLEGKAFFHELHSTDFELLRKFARTNRYRKAIHGDGFVESVGLFPPASRRGAAIIDPSYEIKDDYQRVVDYIETMYKRFNSGVYMIWYPVVDRYRIDQMEKGLVKAGVRDVQLYELNVAADTEERGMTGSGMIVINAPFTLKQQMATVLPFLTNNLAGQDGFFRLEQLVEE
jgi:23S rRNA (adenine2030-N6)-methyltransferase